MNVANTKRETNWNGIDNADVAEQWVAHGAAGRAGFEINVVLRGPVNGGITP